jgi:hypothetical protein
LEKGNHSRLLANWLIISEGVADSNFIIGWRKPQPFQRVGWIAVVSEKIERLKSLQGPGNQAVRNPPPGLTPRASQEIPSRADDSAGLFQGSPWRARKAPAYLHMDRWGSKLALRARSGAFFHAVPPLNGEYEIPFCTSAARWRYRLLTSVAAFCCN